MAIVTYPNPTRHSAIGLRPMSNVFQTRSEITHARQVVDSGYSWWEASLTVGNMTDEDARAWRLFFGRCRGASNTFRVPVTKREQHTGAFTVQSNGTGTGFSLPTDGWPANTTAMRADDLVTVGDQLMRLDADVTANGSGQATLQFHAPLRGTVANNTLIETRSPWLMASLPESSPILTVSMGDIQPGFSFEVMEAF